MELIWNKIKTYASLVMFEHTLFALPFAYLALFLAADGWPSFYHFFWVTVAMVGARNGANAWNRLADREIDRRNPRTAGRHLPQGKVSTLEVGLLAFFCFALLVLAAYMLNPICLKLLPVAILLVVFYSYTKRFTWTCHLFLGLAEGMAPVGAWLAVTGRFSFGIFILAVVQGLWVAGFDIIYATQDFQFDRKEGIHSIPARFGIANALKIAGLFHIVTIFLLLILDLFYPLSWVYYLGVLLIGVLLMYEHNLVSPEDLRQVKIASYSINQIIGPLLLIAGILDIIIL